MYVYIYMYIYVYVYTYLYVSSDRQEAAIRTSHHYPLRLPHSLQNTVTHCKPSQHTLQQIANHGNTLQHTTVSDGEKAATRTSHHCPPWIPHSPRRTYLTRCNTLQHTETDYTNFATYWNTWQHAHHVPRRANVCTPDQSQPRQTNTLTHLHTSTAFM